MANELAAALLLTTLALAFVLLLRKPIRRLFGAGPAFSLWLLVPALASAAWLRLPALVRLPSLPFGIDLRALSALVVHPGADNITTTGALADETSLTWITILLSGWLVGALVSAAHLLLLQWRLRIQAAAPTNPERAALARHMDPAMLARVRTHPVGPAVLFGWPSLLLLPPNFAQRFSAKQRSLVLGHEHMHLRRGDPWWRLLAELTRVLLWFHPLVWLALPRFRIDQELACDAATLQQREHHRTDYARTLLNDLQRCQASIVAGWIHPSQLKERLVMLKSKPVHAIKRRSGYALVLAAIGTFALATMSALSVPQAAQAEVAQTMPPVISVNLVPQGIFWNGEEVDGVGLQHRAIVAARINPATPVLVTQGLSPDATRANKIADVLAQSGLNNVDVRHIDNSLLPASNDQNAPVDIMAYRATRQPQYPVAAIMAKHEGTVTVKVLFAEDGTALGARASAPGVAPELVKSALASSLSWRATPGRSEWKRIPIKYALSPMDPGKQLKKLPALPSGQKWQIGADGHSIRSVPLDAPDIQETDG